MLTDVFLIYIVHGLGTIPILTCISIEHALGMSL